jgi:small subunit ribosomal protein S4
MPKRKHKKFNRPRKIYDKAIIKEEQALIKKYGLKNRREVWKADYAISKIRNIAKTLITANEEDKEKFINRQKAKGFEVNNIADILGLNKEDYLKRRLQTIALKKGYAKTPTQARQLITHKHVKLNGNIINSPSHLTTLEEEKSISSKTIINKDKITLEEKEILEKIKPKEEEK